MSGVVWLSPEAAIRAILAAEESGTELLGFDGAWLRENGTQPSLEDSWDYARTASPPAANRYAHAIQFIKDRALKGLHFEIVLRTPTLN